MLIEVMKYNFATREDLMALEKKVEWSFLKLESRFEQLEYRMTIKIGSLLIIGFGVMTTLLKLLLAS